MSLSLVLLLSQVWPGDGPGLVSKRQHREERLLEIEE